MLTGVTFCCWIFCFHLVKPLMPILPLLLTLLVKNSTWSDLRPAIKRSWNYGSKTTTAIDLQFQIKLAVHDCSAIKTKVIIHKQINENNFYVLFSYKAI